jgi:hypothetical protein
MRIGRAVMPRRYKEAREPINLGRRLAEKPSRAVEALNPDDNRIIAVAPADVSQLKSAKASLQVGNGFPK